ncbi:MAG: glycosyltransferase [Planctomycetaceae bacterium]
MSDSSQPVPIAFCITDLDPGGAERALVQLVTRLDREKWRPEVFCLTQQGDLVESLEANQIPVTCLGVSGRANVWVIFRLARLLRRFRPAILQTFLYHANIVGRLAGWIARVPNIVSGIRVAEKRSRFRLWMDRWTEWLVKQHVCVSEDVAQFSIERGGLSPDKIRTIPNGVDYEHFSKATPADLQRFGIPPDSRTVISVGRLDPQKNPQLILEAFQPVVNAVRNAHLLFVGSGILEKQLREQASQLGLENHVHFAGTVPDVAPLLKASDCFVLASRWEGMPNAVLEAMAAGIPVVCTRVEGVRDLVVEGKTGLLIPQENRQQLAESMLEILQNPQRAADLAREAQTLVFKDYTWGISVKNYQVLYEELLEKAPSLPG